jgi:ComF family protein
MRHATILFMATARRVLTGICELIYPRACLACGQLLTPEQTDWCTACTARLLSETQMRYCPRCAAPAEPYMLDPTGCRSCRGASTPLEGIACVGPYTQLLGQLIRDYKYRRRQELDAPMGKLLTSAIRGMTWWSDLDALVPVPASLPERLRYRFWPVGLLARQVGRSLSLPDLPLLVVRGKKRRQVDVPPSGRESNVRGIFRLRRGARLGGARLCLIDDVTTSGATLRAAALALKRAGAASVYAGALARGGVQPPQKSHNASAGKI